MSSELAVNMEPLPGYRLIERLGAGGYGEVWRAEAPGGLTKAIKFVFGKHDEKRASYELGALERVRSVRHPFLVSLERIEVVDGKLLVVTELADASIKDRFEQCRREGLRGIPREELIGYLRDAADALDFMGQVHALQHLDIKPENLLLLAGHVKVADFGLVKDVRQPHSSAVRGMTPQYAAPEVFRGIPSSHSDQYSLAILYQELLTGTLPFRGRGAAELTLQHLNHEPDLNALPPWDRQVVARALAKGPQARHPTCREFVDMLSSTRSTESVPHVDRPAAGTFVALSQFAELLPTANTETDLFDDDLSSAWNAPSTHRLIELPPADESLVSLPAIPMSSCDTRPVPTLILGVGGAAGQVLFQLRRMLCGQHGNPASLPSIQMLLVDTDAKALAELGRRDDGLAPTETMNLPLRRPQQYREQSQQLLQWLSRRWLYNIPRSLRTEGLRPLGRLAFADHARQVGQRVRKAILQATNAAALGRSSQTLGREFRSDALRVYIVASISGGTGSGMALDLGYTVRAVLNKLGVPDPAITGVLMHATGGDPRHCELARVNAFSWLTEFNHFLQPENAYPGDMSCGLPAHEPGVPPFDDTYLIYLGEQLDAIEFDQAALSVAEYLRLSVATTAGAFFEACRRESDPGNAKSAGGRATVRSFGIQRRTADEGDFGDGFANEVANQVVRRWRSTDPLDAQGTVPPGTSELVQRLRMNAQGIATNSRALVLQRLGRAIESFLSSWMAERAGTESASEASQIQAIDRIVSAGGARGDAECRPSLLGEDVETLGLPLAENLRGEICRWIMARIDDPSDRTVGACAAIQWLNDHFQRVESDLTQFHATVAAKVADLRQRFVDSAHAPLPSGRSERALHYFRLRLDQLAVDVAAHTARFVVLEIARLAEQIHVFSGAVEPLQAHARHSYMAGIVSDSWDANNPQASAIQARASALESRLSELAIDVDRRLEVEFLAAKGGLMQVISCGGRQRAQLNAKLREYAQQAVNRAVAGLRAVEELIGGPADVQSDLRSVLAAATPSLVQFGGTRRVLAILPRDAAALVEAETLEAKIGTAVTTLAGDDTSLLLCVEASQLPIDYTAVEFVQRRRDRVDFAGRVHSRTDILWTPLLSIDCESSPWGGDDDSERQASQDRDTTLVI